MIVENFKKLPNQPLCYDDLESMKQWKWNQTIIMNQAFSLTIEGYNELRSIAKNYQNSFPHLLGKIYDSKKIHFRHTDKARTRDSYRAFVDGLFGENVQYVDAGPPPNQPDFLLKVYFSTQHSVSSTFSHFLN